MPRNRTIDDTGTLLDGNLLVIPPVEDTGVTPEQAVAVAGPLANWIASLPYYLDEQDQIAYRGNTTTLTHTPELRYGPGHPQEGELIEAAWNDGAYVVQYGGAPMPFIDMDLIGPVALRNLLIILRQILQAQASAT